MFKYGKTFLLIIICMCTLKNNAQPEFGALLDSKYTVTIGTKRITPSHNVNKYASLKKELSNNFYENVYHVLVQFNDAPNTELKSQMNGKIYNELAVSNNTFISAINANINQRTLKKLNVRAVIALSPEMKINPKVIQSTEEMVKVNFVIPKGIKDALIINELEKYGAEFKLKFMADSVNKYTYLIDKSHLETIAQLPWILQIEEGGMR